MVVDDGQTATTMLRLFDDQWIITEPAWALSVAALDQLEDKIVGKNVVCITCGGNFDFARLDPVSWELRETLAEQFAQIIQNIDAVLAQAGTDKQSVVKTTIFVVDMEQYAMVNNMYADYFGEHAPARSTVEVSRLPKDALVEIEVIAVITAV